MEQGGNRDTKRLAIYCAIAVAAIAVIAILLTVIIKVKVGSSNRASVSDSSAMQQVADMAKTAEHYVDLTANPAEITKADDFYRLPGLTSDSFKEYLNGRLKKIRPDKNGCADAFIISQVSEVNVGGTITPLRVKPAADESRYCSIGKRFIWTYKDGKWTEVPYQAVTKCQVLIDNVIYSEFLRYCNDGQTFGDQKDNPNGSVADRGE